MPTAVNEAKLRVFLVPAPNGTGIGIALRQNGIFQQDLSPLDRTFLASSLEFERHLRSRVYLRQANERVPIQILTPALAHHFLKNCVQQILSSAKTLNTKEQLQTKLLELLTTGTPLRLQQQPELIADASVLAGLASYIEAEPLIEKRQIKCELDSPDPQLGKTHFTFHWRPTTAPNPQITAELNEQHALIRERTIDALSRYAFATASTSANKDNHKNRIIKTDPTVSLDPNNNDNEAFLEAITSNNNAFPGEYKRALATQDALNRAYSKSQTGLLTSTGLRLVARIITAPTAGASWGIQIVLKEKDGTLHPLAEALAAGEITAQESIELTAQVLRAAPILAHVEYRREHSLFSLDLNGMNKFLSEDAETLQANGIDVLLPREWTKTPVKIRAIIDSATPDEKSKTAKQQKAEEGNGIGLQTMARFKIEASLGEHQLDDAELAELRETQAELVYLRGQWVRLNHKTLLAASRFIEQQLSPKNGARPIGELLGVIASREANDLDIEVSGDLPWKKATQVANALNVDADLKIPSLKATLRPYQARGVRWLEELGRHGYGAILADDMGLGKTIQLLALLCLEREQAELQRQNTTTKLDVTKNSSTEQPAVMASDTIDAKPNIGPTLMVAPVSLAKNWQLEARKFAPGLKTLIHHGPDRATSAAGWEKLDLVITTYSLLDRDLELLSSVAWQRVVFDEAQFLKNRGTAVSKAARQLPAATKIALTGTPIENKLLDLHTLIDLVNPGILGSASAFQEAIAGPIEKERDPSALARLHTLTAPFMLRRLKTDPKIINDLPEKTEKVLLAPLTPEQAGLYEAVVKEMLIEVDGAEPNQRRAAIVSALTKLKQICNHPAQFLGDGSGVLAEVDPANNAVTAEPSSKETDIAAAGKQHRSGKVASLETLLDQIFAAGEKVLLFTQFTEFGYLLLPYLEERYGFNIPFLHGGVKPNERQEMVEDFQSHPHSPGALMLSLRAGGTGLTLTAARHVIHLDRWWNPAVENQATDRAYRIGQKNPVLVHKLVCQGTVEERINEVLANKTEVASLGVKTGENWLAELEDQTLAEMFTLSRGEFDE